MFETELDSQKKGDVRRNDILSLSHTIQSSCMIFRTATLGLSRILMKSVKLTSIITQVQYDPIGTLNTTPEIMVQ